MSPSYDIAIVGAGLSGLTCAYYLKKLEPQLRIVILERSGTAGGLTGNWIDHRLGPKKKLQYPMHMIFVSKYRNLCQLINEVGAILSPRYTGYDIITSDQKRHRLEMKDWTSKKLPPPFHSLGMFARLNLSLRAKWDLFKLACICTYCADYFIRHKDNWKKFQEPPYVPNTLSLESLELILRLHPEARDFVETATPSIYNSHPWYTSAPKMAAVIAGTMVMDYDSLHYQVFGKNYNPAFIDNFVEKLKQMGVDFKFWTEVRRIDANKKGNRIEAIWYKPYGPEAGGIRYVCENCGAENYCLDRAFCTRCGLDTTLDKIGAGKIHTTVANELWAKPQKRKYERLECSRLITAIYPHMIAKLIPLDSPLRKNPFVISMFSSKLNQTQLSIARVYYKKQITDQKYITGTHNPTFCFNGCQSVYNNFGGEDLDHEGDVIDVLLDVGVVRDAHSPQTQIQRIIHDLHKVYPDANPSLVEYVSFANIYPEVLYHSEQPSIAGSYRFFNRHRTEVENWYVAGCHSGSIGIGMESAVESAKSTVNCILEDMGSSKKVEILSYQMHPFCKLVAKLGEGLLWWKGAGKFYRKAAKTQKL
ncbi:MAG: FAD-dependent oxidoreductase [Planctomycetota bacterium]|nr:MAG: FAD-dependent oxidoreductase [Planctomycetota bacterium]